MSDAETNAQRDVQGHTFTTVLDPAHHVERWFRHHSFVHGYTAPMFLFASGLAFGYTTFARWESQTQPGPALTKRFQRYGWLLLIGYLLHMPALSLSELASVRHEQAWHAWLQVDVLQHIAISLGALQLVAMLVKKQRPFVLAVAGMFAASVFLAPIISRWAVETHLPFALTGFINQRTGSYFPLFPWAGFTHAGVLVAYAARNLKQPSQDFAWPLVGLTAVLAIVPIVINRTGLQLYGPHDFWKTDPYYFFFRLANVLGVLATWSMLERIAERQGWLDETRGLANSIGFVRVVGAESLLIYVVHLVILHGSIGTVGIVARTGATLSLGEATLVALLLFGAMVVLARMWTEFKRSSIRFRTFQVIMAVAVGYLVLAR